MNNFFDNIINWIGDFFKPVSDFFYTYRNSPFLWIGLLLVGLFITKITIDALSKKDTF